MREVDLSKMSAGELKDLGNRFFTAQKYSEAVSCYSKAIIKNSSVATYFTNRALCYLKLKLWDSVIQDCRRALDLDKSSVKAHFFQGEALLELHLYDEAIPLLKRAHDLARDQKKNFGDDITTALRVAKRKRWSMLEEKRVQQEIELQTYLNRLILEDAERQLARRRMTTCRSMFCRLFRRKSALKRRDVSPDLTEQREAVETDAKTRMKEVNDLFAQVDERRRTRDVHDFLCGKISFELMREPCITPSGITYDRKDIEEHLQRVGHFDPVTRTDLTQDMLIPNLAMKEVITHFLEENPWAEDY